MIDVRLFFQKRGEACYISHLDLNRFMLRAIRRTGLPVWYTEGFNPHVYITFALPLPLGQFSEREIMDFRLIQECDLCKVKEAFSQVMPLSLPVLEVAYPVEKTKEIAYAAYDILLPEGAVSLPKIEKVLAQDQIMVEKTTKKGAVKWIDLKSQLRGIDPSIEGKDLRLHVVLPAGAQNNINPALLVEALKKSAELQPIQEEITRKEIYNAKMEIFR